MSDFLVRRFGWRGMLVHGDPVVLERWKWLRHHTDFSLGSATGQTLDAGCGNGCFAIWAATMGGEVLGLSDSAGDTHKARQRAALLGLDNVRFEEFDLRRLPAEGDRFGEFDAIFCLEVIEHVLDDVSLLEQIAARMRPGATLFLTTPTDDHKPLFNEVAHQTTVEDGRHVRWGYSEKQLEVALRAAGLEPVAFTRFGGYLTQRVCGALGRLSRINRHLAWVITFPLRVVTLIDDQLTAATRRPFLSVGVIARKPTASAA